VADILGEIAADPMSVARALHTGYPEVTSLLDRETTDG
jgi:hypothetical protein